MAMSILLRWTVAPLRGRQHAEIRLILMQFRPISN
jgi:hypothetical protein